MTNHLQQSQRAIGALFFTGFGALWLLGWVAATFPWAPAALLPLALATAALAYCCLRQYHWHRARAIDDDNTPARQRRIRRQFHLVNGGQWLAVVIVISVLNHTGHGAWLLPAVIAIVGLHCLPLAAIFHSLPHAVTGLALLALALFYPHWAAGGAADAIGALGAGLILWCSAAWAIRPTPGSFLQQQDDGLNDI